MTEGKSGAPSDQLASLEARLSTLEAQVAGLTQPQPQQTVTSAWALETLQTQLPQGGLLFTGHVQLGAGGDWVWQETHPAAALLQADWPAVAGSLAALGHPKRLALLQAALAGPLSAATLGERTELSGGQLYHHLRELQAAGWLQAQARGPYRIPGDRVIPLLTILAACGVRDQTSDPSEQASGQAG